MSRSAEQCIRELSADLAPVRPVPPLRSWLAAALALWVAAAAVDWLVGGPPPRHDGAWGRVGFLGVLVAQLAVALGATLAALASAVPGREREARLGWGAAALGGLGLAGHAIWALTGSGAAIASFVLPWFCIGRAGWIGVLPAVALAVFAGRAFAVRAVSTALAAGLGAAALGALVVQASCLDDGALHVCLGHAAGPAAVGLLLAAFGTWWLRRTRVDAP